MVPQPVPCKENKHIQPMIVEIFKDVCKRVSEKVGYEVNYIFGDSPYIRETLLIAKKYPKTSSVRFPLIGLYTPFTEHRKDRNVYCTAEVNLIIAVNTLKEYTNEQRLEVSFEKFLRPLYDALIAELRADRRLDFGYQRVVRHDYSENFVFGRRGAYDSDGKEVEEKIDAIEINNLELTVKTQNCYATRL